MQTNQPSAETADPLPSGAILAGLIKRRALAPFGGLDPVDLSFEEVDSRWVITVTVRVRGSSTERTARFYRDTTAIDSIRTSTDGAIESFSRMLDAHLMEWWLTVAPSRSPQRDHEVLW